MRYIDRNPSSELDANMNSLGTCSVPLRRRDDIVARSIGRSRWDLARLLEARFIGQLDARWRFEAERLQEAIEHEGAISKAKYQQKATRRFREMTRDTYTNSPKPTTCNRENGQTSFSHPTPRLTTQMPRVLHVSIVLLVVALTLLVTLRPKKLNEPIENMIAKQDK